MKLQVKDLSFDYGSTAVLKHIDFTVEKGEMVSLVGPNGAGKSTLLKCINRIVRPSGGTVLIDGRDVKRLRLKELARYIGYVPQTVQHAFPATVSEIVLMGRRPYMNWTVGAGNREIVYDLLIRMDLAHLAQRQFNELSGGERQRVLIARALAQEPQVVLLDEPTSNLDIKHQLTVLDLVAAIVKTKGVSVIMAIHDLNMAARYSDRIVFLKKGEIHTSGSPGETLVSGNIRKVYEVEAMVNNDSGRPHVIPVGTAPAS